MVERGASCIGQKEFENTAKTTKYTRGGITHMRLHVNTHIEVYKLRGRIKVYMGPEKGAEQSVPSVLLYEYFS